MAAYYGEVSGSRGAVSRLGGADGGVRSYLKDWSQGVITTLRTKNGVPWLHVERTGAAGRVIYDGPLADA